MLRFFVGIFVGIFAITLAATTFAQEAGFDASVAAADVIFEGRVERIEHRMSDVLQADHVALPLTYVTFRVERLFKGAVTGSREGDRLTLRFLGGPLGDGRTMQPSNGTLFEEGAREILLVKNADIWGVPLVHGAHRRFTLVGSEVRRELGGALAIPGTGGRSSLDGFRELIAERLERLPTRDALGRAVRSADPDTPFGIVGPRAVAAN